jgi:hypothetical protein
MAEKMVSGCPMDAPLVFAQYIISPVFDKPHSIFSALQSE